MEIPRIPVVPPQPATLAKNPLYRIGRLPASRCAEPEHEPTSLASVRAYYGELLACMNKAWAPAIRKAGFTFRPPKLVVTEGRSASSPCECADGLACIDGHCRVPDRGRGGGGAGGGGGGGAVDAGGEEDTGTEATGGAVAAGGVVADGGVDAAAGVDVPQNGDAPPLDPGQTDPNEQESVVLLPELESLPHLL